MYQCHICGVEHLKEDSATKCLSCDEHYCTDCCGFMDEYPRFDRIDSKGIIQYGVKDFRECVSCRDSERFDQLHEIVKGRVDYNPHRCYSCHGSKATHWDYLNQCKNCLRRYCGQCAAYTSAFQKSTITVDMGCGIESSYHLYYECGFCTDNKAARNSIIELVINSLHRTGDVESILKIAGVDIERVKVKAKREAIKGDLPRKKLAA